ncbi:hypothetical protein V8E54_012298 [Elaphomyces granulatus]|jgi:hypothetical protein
MDSDDTGSKLDSELLINTITSFLPGVISATYEIPSKGTSSEVLNKYCELRKSLSGDRKLIIFHYAGHALRGSTSCNLSLTPKIHDPEDEISPDEDFLDFSLIKAGIKEEAQKLSGLDILFIMDCCCSAAGGRGPGS